MRSAFASTLLIVVLLPIAARAQGVDSLLALGNAHYNNSRYSQSLEVYKQAQTALGADSSSRTAGHLRCHLGLAHEQLGHMPEAMAHFYATRRIGEQLKNSALEGKALARIANVQFRQGKKAAAMQSVREAIQIIGAGKEQAELGTAFNILGGFFLRELQLDSAQRYFQEALEVNTDANRMRETLGNRHNLAMIEQGQHHDSLALAMLQHILTDARHIGDHYYECYALRSIGGNHAKNGRFEQALTYLQASNNLADTIGAVQISLLTLENMKRVYSLSKNYEQAYALALQQQALSDSIARMRYDDRIALLETNYKTQQLEAARAIDQEKLARRDQLLVAVVVAALLLAALIWLLMSRINLRKRLTLERDLNALEQKALRLQMNPHFIFNSINTIQGYITEKNTSVAKRYLTRFAKLMRLTLNSSATPEIALEQEVELLDHYLVLSALRFGDRLSYRIETGALDLESLLIPPMLVQPFVENAVLHGIAPRETGGEVLVEFAQGGKGLRCTVTDNGIGRVEAERLRAASGIEHGSMGMQVTRQRLELLNAQHGLQADIVFEDLANSDGSPAGTRVSFNLPGINAWT